MMQSGIVVHCRIKKNRRRIASQSQNHQHQQQQFQDHWLHCWLSSFFHAMNKVKPVALLTASRQASLQSTSLDFSYAVYICQFICSPFHAFRFIGAIVIAFFCKLVCKMVYILLPRLPGCKFFFQQGFRDWRASSCCIPTDNSQKYNVCTYYSWVVRGNHYRKENIYFFFRSLIFAQWYNLRLMFG